MLAGTRTEIPEFEGGPSCPGANDQPEDETALCEDDDGILDKDEDAADDPVGGDDQPPALGGAHLEAPEDWAPLPHVVEEEEESGPCVPAGGDVVMEQGPGDSPRAAKPKGKRRNSTGKGLECCYAIKQ